MFAAHDQLDWVLDTPLLIGAFDGSGPESGFTAFAERLAHHLVEHGIARPA